MSTAQAPLKAPLVLEIPQLHGKEDFDEAEWHVLLSVLDAVIPHVPVSAVPSSHPILQNVRPDMMEAFLAERPSQIPLFLEVLRKTLTYIREDGRKGLRMVLYLLDTRPGSLALTGHLNPWTSLTVDEQTLVLNKWATSNISAFRVLFKQFTTLGRQIWARTSPGLHAVTGFPPVPAGWTPAPDHELPFVEFPADHQQQPVELETDVVIVGSGCGAGVCAKNLAEAGHRVLVVEKGRHFPNAAFPLDQVGSFMHTFDQSGTLASDDGSVAVLSASCFGGGGTINWSASLQTQSFVRDEWANERGLKHFHSAEFQASLDRVCEHMGVREVMPNHQNRVVREGARKMGFHVSAVPQNVGGCEHDDGYCTLGCWRGEKRGPVRGWFPDAAKHGAKFMERCTIENVLSKRVGGKMKAVGVEGVWEAKESDGSAPSTVKVTIRAKRVIVCGGTIRSPLLLLKSGLKNRHIGRNLYLHPTTGVIAVFKHETRPWEGGALTSVVSSFENLDGKGHGVKIETTSMMPSFVLPYLNWTSGTQFKLLASKVHHMGGYICIARDRDTGQVYPDPATGLPRVAYTPSAFDRANNMTGVIAMAKMLYVEGAAEIHPAITGIRPFIRHDYPAEEADSPSITNPHFQAWLSEVEKHGNPTPITPFASAHQMGTCRMSSKPGEGVVDSQGQVWGTEDLYVADASVFPSASGMNPMVTIMAIADGISRGIAKGLAATEDSNTARL